MISSGLGDRRRLRRAIPFESVGLVSCRRCSACGSAADPAVSRYRVFSDARRCSGCGARFVGNADTLAVWKTSASVTAYGCVGCPVCSVDRGERVVGCDDDANGFNERSDRCDHEAAGRANRPCGRAAESPVDENAQNGCAHRAFVGNERGDG